MKKKYIKPTIKSKSFEAVKFLDNSNSIHEAKGNRHQLSKGMEFDDEDDESETPTNYSLW